MTEDLDDVEYAALCGFPDVPPDETVAYGDHPSQVVGRYAAARPTGTRVTLLHGGFWRETYDRWHLSPLAAELARQGMDVALVEYRRLGGGGGRPQTFDDVLRALQTLEALEARSRRPAARHLLVGHSAGGHLALWAASAPGRPAAPAVDGVVAVAAVTDLERAAELRLSEGVVEELLDGGDGRDIDPVRCLPARAPVTLLHGVADLVVPVEFSHRYRAAARAAGGVAEVRALGGVGHFAPVTPGTAACAALLAALTGQPHVTAVP
ncbi:alpha/beta hydrolase [Streptomyces netropsis]|uniref:Acetyl esterase/lipase n=1 Tax=Streptomyces netropsis TaxID=55404 RepID=A0A7W7LCA5_STRNE|nr:alpha/beta hydrolase [Streptomyces netropsis]MBB4887565.1 acetyl esterase/lipase [Streptomyces netropsis]GGR34869.1 lipase [Streptomyces netropsis]